MWTNNSCNSFISDGQFFRGPHDQEFCKTISRFYSHKSAGAEFASWDCSLTDRMTGKIFLRIWSVHFLLQFIRELLVSPIIIFILYRCTYLCKAWLNRIQSIPDIFQDFLHSGQMYQNTHKKSIRFRQIDIYHFLCRMFYNLQILGL